MTLHELKPSVPSCVLGLDCHLVNQGAEGVCLIRFPCLFMILTFFFLREYFLLLSWENLLLLKNVLKNHIDIQFLMKK